jgi:hypothetical protein
MISKSAVRDMTIKLNVQDQCYRNFALPVGHTSTPWVYNVQDQCHRNFALPVGHTSTPWDFTNMIFLGLG